MNWFSSGRVDTFRFVRVRWGTWTETEELEGIIGGTLERNDSTAIKASGSLDYILEPALGSDLVRVYSDSYYPPTGERTSIAQGTYLASTPSSTYRGAIEEGTADLYGVLHVLARGRSTRQRRSCARQGCRSSHLSPPPRSGRRRCSTTRTRASWTR